jgi:two-component system sensor kinase FixL
MSMMAGTLAHEINQPLTAASNYLNVVRKIAGDPDQRHRSTIIDTTELAISQVQRAATIIRRVRAMVRNSTDRSSTASIPEVVESSLALLAACGVCRQGVISVDIQNGLPDVKIDSIQLQQVVINLLRNAVEAAPANDPEIQIKVFEFDRQTVQVEVVDNGPGFPQGHEDPLSPFDSSDKEQGLGLGLSISRTIIEYHEGSLAVIESAPGRTVVGFWLAIASGLASDHELPQSLSTYPS